MGRAGTKFMFKTENQAIIAGIAGICVAGGTLALSWKAYVADRMPGTFNPAWRKATVKYRAAQNQDPITQGMNPRGWYNP